MSNEIPNIIHSEHISNNQISNNFEILSNTIIRYMELGGYILFLLLALRLRIRFVLTHSPVIPDV